MTTTTTTTTVATTATATLPKTRRIPRVAWSSLSRETIYRILTWSAILLSVILTVRMRNTAFIDEALYINAGHAYLDHWLLGTPLGDAGSYFSGAPILYPVLAALIDSLGGLLLVRAFSMICVIGAALALQATARHLWGRRAGLLTLTIFVLTGPVIFTAGLATFDALVVLMLSVSLWLGITRTSAFSAVLLGLLLPLMAATKYTAMIFVPVVIAAMVVTTQRRHLARVFITPVVAAAVLGLAYLNWGAQIQESLAFTTTARKALSPTTTPVLVNYVWGYIGALLLLALIGAFVISFTHPGPRSILISLGLFGAAMMLPVAQMRLGEEVSFQKHLAYSAVFLCLLAGAGLAWLSRLPLMTSPVVLLLMVITMIGWARADVMYDWVNVAPVVRIIEKDPKPGVYLSSATDSLKYHTKEIPGITWQTSFVLYSTGPEGIKRAVADHTLQTVILRTASTGSPEQDARQRILLDALRKSPSYHLAHEPFKVTRYGDDRWLMYSLVPQVESTTPANQSPPNPQKR